MNFLAMETPWFVYILLCRDNSYYVGITPNVKRRLQLHNSGKGAQYTRIRLPVSLLYQEKYQHKSEARKREIQLKGWSRKKKEMLIREHL